MNALTERAITATMAGTITEDEFELVVDIDLRVRRQVTCPVTGQVLDSRTAVLFSVADQSIAVSPDGIDTALARTEHLGDATVQVIPARVLEALR